MNTFSRSLAPSLRISYMVLPPALLERYQRTLGFYSCTVPAMEQYTLARFLSEGYFETHVNRMRGFYRGRRDQVLDALARSPLAGAARYGERTRDSIFSSGWRRIGMTAIWPGRRRSGRSGCPSCPITAAASLMFWWSAIPGSNWPACRRR